jgi:hypothetical protein
MTYYILPPLAQPEKNPEKNSLVDSMRSYKAYPIGTTYITLNYVKEVEEDQTHQVLISIRCTLGGILSVGVL